MIYTITTINPHQTATKTGRRTVGYYPGLPHALKDVEENCYDISESGSFKYAVIEHIKEGLYQYDRKAIWYKWSKAKQTYIRMSRPPKKYKNIVGFGMG